MEYLNNIHWIILIVSLFVTLIVWIGFLNFEYNLQSANFENTANLITQSVLDRLEQDERIVMGGKGLFAASSKVELNEWKRFIETQNIDVEIPGIQGIGYAHHIVENERSDLVNELKNYGLSDFEIHPEGTRDEYYPVVFLEPQDFRNKRAMGYDIYVENTRHDAVNLVKETGKTTMTGKVILVQETENDIQNGFLMLVPIYQNNRIVTESELQGIVFGVFRMNDFIQGIFDLDTFQYLHMRIYDNTLSETNLFFDSDDVSPTLFEKNDFTKTIEISKYNRSWIFVFEGVQPPYQGIEQIALFLIPIVGISMSVLLFYVFSLFKNFTIKQQQLNILQDVERQKHEFLSMITHELKTPLTPITGWAEALKNPKMTGELTDVQKKAVDSIYANALKLNKLITDFLDVQKLELHKIELHDDSFDVDEFVKTICNNFEPEFKSNNVTLQNNCNTNITIIGDKYRLEQIFNNIINNALDFIPKNTGVVEINAHQKEQFLIFSIKDNGIGISQDNQKKLFNKFYQIDSSIIRKHGGTGLGLSICAGLVSMMDGKIWCESQLNKGTIFYIQIPINGRGLINEDSGN